MRVVVLRGLAERKLRVALTALAVVLGVAMISGTYVLTAQITGAFDDIFLASNKGIATIVLPKESYKDRSALAATLEVNGSLVERVRRVPGVRAAAGERDDQGVLVYHGVPIKPTTGSPALVISYSPPPLEGAARWVAGRPPRAIDEVSVDKRMADEHHIRAGDSAQVATATGLKSVRITGIVDFPVSVGGSVFVIDTLRASQLWYGKPGQVSRILVAAAPGVSEDALTRRVAAALKGSPVTVKSGTKDAKDNAKDINDTLGKVLQGILLTFGLIAILVGAFIIRNTFTITVAQRTREFALLRALGATRRQIRWGVIAEGAVIGVLASTAGLFGGLAVAAGFSALFDAAGIGLPKRGLGLTSAAILNSYEIGIGITVYSALAPARRAMHVAPAAAMQEGAVLPPTRFARLAWLWTLILALGGAGLITWSFVAGAMTTDQRLLVSGGGALLVFAAVATGARYVVEPVARAIGWPLERIAGITGALARDNAARNPSRTASTSAALMIGVALVVFVSVLAAGLKNSMHDAVRGAVRADVVVQSTTFARMPAKVTTVVRRTKGIELAVPFYAASARDQRKRLVQVIGSDPRAFAQVFEFDWKRGSAAAFEALGPHGAVVDDQFAKRRGWGPGTQLTLSTRAGRSNRVTIRGVFDSEHGALSGVLLSQAGYSRLTNDREPVQILAKASSGTSSEAVAHQVADALRRPFPLAEARSTDEWIKSLEAQVNALVYLLYALLSMSVLISLFGIVNTLVLSIFERTREIGMLRAIGESRWQVRSMIAGESVITAIIGAALGIAVGLFFAFVISAGLHDQGLGFALPLAQLAAMVVLAVVAGLISAVFPARRAARLEPIEALLYE